MTIETSRDLAGLLSIGRIVGETLQRMGAAVQPGMTTGQLDEIGRRFLERHHARPAPAMTSGFPGVACISINDEAAHGIPGQRVIAAGDVVKIDVSAERGGYFADAAVTVVAQPAPGQHERLAEGAKAVLAAAIAAAIAGQPLHRIGAAAEQAARARGFAVVRELCAHGIGRSLHEPPDLIPQYFDPAARRRLSDGLVLTVEPHVTTGKGALRTGDDGWTLLTRDKQPVAQFEHTIIVTREQPVIVTQC